MLWLVLFRAPVADTNMWPELSAVLAQGLPIKVQKHMLPMLDNLQTLSAELAAGFSMNAALQFEALLYQWLEPQFKL